ncbi:MAG TPA: DNA cytosine methyltransferase [Thermoproteales archaeon]|nr:DNA cytosine methyltransferase [Thermoproteales archaeon]
MVEEFTVIDIFSGAGGFSRGFKEEGFKILLGLDNYPPAARTFRENFKESFFIEEDVKEIHSEDIINTIGCKPDVVIGGPPCEAFTRTNVRRERIPLNRLYKDPLGQLTLHFIRIVGDIKPKVFVMENVPGIIENGLALALRREFKRVGYSEIFFNILKAEDYGVPSHRKRVFISNIRIKPPKVRKRITVIEAIGDLPPPGTGEIPNHEYVSISRKKLRKIAKLRWGEALIHYQGAEGKIYRNYIRLHPFKIAPTVMGSSRFVHPFENRLLTVREQARLMSFPDDHVFYGSKDAQFNQVGEAVPVKLSQAIAQEVKKYLLGKFK